MWNATKDLMQAKENLDTATKKLAEAMAEGQLKLDSARARIREELAKDAQRKAELFEKCKDTPREELRIINEKLSAVPAEKDAAFWVRYYQGHTGGIHETEQKRLKKRKEELERQLALLPATAEEIELSQLRLKEYSLTPKEQETARKAAEEISARYVDYSNAVEQLRNAADNVSKGLKHILQSLDNHYLQSKNDTFQIMMDSLQKAAAGKL